MSLQPDIRGDLTDHLMKSHLTVSNNAIVECLTRVDLASLDAEEDFDDLNILIQAYVAVNDMVGTQECAIKILNFNPSIDWIRYWGVESSIRLGDLEGAKNLIEAASVNFSTERQCELMINCAKMLDMHQLAFDYYLFGANNFPPFSGGDEFLLTLFGSEKVREADKKANLHLLEEAVDRIINAEDTSGKLCAAALSISTSRLGLEKSDFIEKARRVLIDKFDPQLLMELAYIENDYQGIADFIEKDLLADDSHIRKDRQLLAYLVRIGLSTGSLSVFGILFKYAHKYLPPANPLRIHLNAIIDLIARFGNQEKEAIFNDSSISIGSTLALAITRLAEENNERLEAGGVEITRRPGSRGRLGQFFKSLKFKKSNTKPPKRVMMFCGSLAAGGAERILSVSLFETIKVYGPENVKLVLLNKGDSEDPAVNPFMFYLRNTGIEFQDIVELQPTPAQELEAEYAALPPFIGKYASALEGAVKDFGPDILHCWLDHCNLIGGSVALNMTLKSCILHSHNMRPSELGLSEMQMNGWASAYNSLVSSDNITFLNCAVTALDDYKDWMRISDKSKGRVIYNGFDFDLFIPLDSRRKQDLRGRLGIPDGSVVIGNALRFSEVKRPDLWVEVAARVSKQSKSVYFMMCGDGDLLNSTKVLAENLGVADRIIFTGRVNNIRDYVGLFDLFLLTSSSEGLPNVLIEAQAVGVPVISTDAGGARETFADGETGRLVDSSDPDMIAKEVLSVISDRQELDAMKSKTRSFVVKRFSIDRMVKSLVDDLYTSL